MFQTFPSSVTIWSPTSKLNVIYNLLIEGELKFILSPNWPLKRQLWYWFLMKIKKYTMLLRNSFSYSQRHINRNLKRKSFIKNILWHNLSARFEKQIFIGLLLFIYPKNENTSFTGYVVYSFIKLFHDRVYFIWCLIPIKSSHSNEWNGHSLNGTGSYGIFYRYSYFIWNSRSKGINLQHKFLFWSVRKRYIMALIEFFHSNWNSLSNFTT